MYVTRFSNLTGYYDCETLEYTVHSSPSISLMYTLPLWQSSHGGTHTFLLICSFRVGSFWLIISPCWRWLVTPPPQSSDNRSILIISPYRRRLLISQVLTISVYWWRLLIPKYWQSVLTDDDSVLTDDDFWSQSTDNQSLLTSHPQVLIISPYRRLIISLMVLLMAP